MAENVTLPAACQALADAVSAGIPALLNRVSYPAPAKIPSYPWAIVKPVEGAITLNTDQLWLDQVVVQVFTALRGNTAAELALIDPYPDRVADLFDLAVPGANSSLTNKVGRCVPTGYRLGLITYADLDHYGGEIVFTIKRHRRHVTDRTV